MNILNIAKRPYLIVIVEVKDWKIIPLEISLPNFIKFIPRFLQLQDPEKSKDVFQAEAGVDRVIFSTSSINVKEAMVYLRTRRFDMKPARIIESETREEFA